MSAAATPQIEPVLIPDDFDRIAARLQLKIAELPPLDIEALHKELAGLAVPPPVVSTFQSINDDIGTIAEYCDRATEIYLQAHRHFHVIDTVANLLYEGWIKFSREKSEANRKGEARLKTAQFAERSIDVAVLLKAADKVSRNLENKYKMLVDQKDCQSRMMRIGEFARTSQSVSSAGPESEEIFDTTKEEAVVSEAQPTRTKVGPEVKDSDIFDTVRAENSTRQEGDSVVSRV